MSIQEQITSHMKAALKAGEKDRLELLRMLISDLKNAAESAGASLDEAGELAVLRKAAKMRREAAEAFRQGGREDLAGAEEQQAAWVDAYLPQQMDAAATETKVKELMAELGISERKDQGRFMKEWMARYRDVSDGKLVSAAFARALEG